MITGHPGGLRQGPQMAGIAAVGILHPGPHLPSQGASLPGTRTPGTSGAGTWASACGLLHQRSRRDVFWSQSKVLTAAWTSDGCAASHAHWTEGPSLDLVRPQGLPELAGVLTHHVCVPDIIQ